VSVVDVSFVVVFGDVCCLGLWVHDRSVKMVVIMIRRVRAVMVPSVACFMAVCCLWWCSMLS